jgi:hypothetical protein
MSPTAVSVTEAPAVDVRGRAAGRGVAVLVASVAAGLAELVGSAVGENAVPLGVWPEEQAEMTSATAGPRIAKSLLRRMRPNLAWEGPTCGDVEPDGDSGRTRRHGMVASIDTEALRRKYAEERDKRRAAGQDPAALQAGEMRISARIRLISGKLWV